jgi:hypothetical protein
MQCLAKQGQPKQSNATQSLAKQMLSKAMQAINNDLDQDSW